MSSSTRVDYSLILAVVFVFAAAYLSSFLTLTGYDTASISSGITIGNDTNTTNTTNETGGNTGNPQGGLGGGGTASGSSGSGGGGGQEIIVDLDKNIAQTIRVSVPTRIKLIYDNKDYFLSVVDFSSSIASFSASFGGFALVEGAEQQFEITGDRQRDVGISFDQFSESVLTLTFLRITPRTTPSRRPQPEHPAPVEELASPAPALENVVEQSPWQMQALIIAITLFVLFCIHWLLWKKHQTSQGETIK